MINIVRRVDWKTRLQNLEDTKSDDINFSKVIPSKTNPSIKTKSKNKTKEQLDAERKEREMGRARRDAEIARQRLSLKLQKKGLVTSHENGVSGLEPSQSAMTTKPLTIHKRPKDDMSDVEM